MIVVLSAHMKTSLRMILSLVYSTIGYVYLSRFPFFWQLNIIQVVHLNDDVGPEDHGYYTTQ